MPPKRQTIQKPVFIFVSGGVISGLGKGITTASLSFLLESHGFRVCPIKCDAYVNVDAGTIRPQEHGEVFVTADGIECDQDIGHYERFINQDLSRANYITTGQIYQEVIRKERNFEYEGEDVEVVPHVPEEMIRRFKEAAKKMNADFVLVEIGGTVGEYQNVLFIEANRIMKVRDKETTLHIHVGYLPTPPSLGEMKSKPVQTSVRLLNETGIQPDILVGRAEKELDLRRRERLSLFCNMELEDVFSDPDIDSIYKVPLIFQKQGLDCRILKKLKIKSAKKSDISAWEKAVRNIGTARRKIKIGMVGKYQKMGIYTFSDAYVSVVESLRHAAWPQGLTPEIVWIDSESIETSAGYKDFVKIAKDLNGLIVPQGWGERGVEGKIRAVQFARENKIPYLGLCFGMQMAVIEFARHVCHLDNANTTEADPKTRYPVIHIMPDQKKYLEKRQYGGTIRLGAWPCVVKLGTILYQTYQTKKISERHRHRYEFNNVYRQKLESAGLVISGTSPDGKLVEAIELPEKVHPFFVGTQFHPEYQSRFLKPHPLFSRLIEVGKKLIK